jgi:hypothetical protein
MKLYALVDRSGHVFADQCQGGAPWEGATASEALAAVKDTLGEIPFGCKIVPLTPALAAEYQRMAAR